MYLVFNAMNKFLNFFSRVLRVATQVYNLFFHLSLKAKRLLLLYFFFVVGTSVSEGMGIFIFASFIKLLTQGGDYLHSSNDLNFLQAFFLFKNSNSLFNLGIMLILVSLNTLIFRVLLLLTSGKSSSRVEAELSYLYSKAFSHRIFLSSKKNPNL